MNNKSIVNNTFWIIGCRIIQSILSLLIGMLTARYLGPSNYGLINYAASIVGFLVPIMQLGLRNILVREFVSHPDREGETLGTALMMNCISAMLSIAGVIAFVSIANRGETETIIVCALYSINLIFQALEMSQYWFQSKLLSKYTSIVSVVAYAVVSAYKVFLLVTKKSIYYFAISTALDYMIISISMLVIYKKIGTQKLSVSLKRAGEMFSVSKYYIVSGMMVTVFGYIGSILLKFMIDESAVGYYTAAVTCAGLTGFVFQAIIDSFRPSILKDKAINTESYQKNIKLLYTIVIYLSIAQAAVFTIFSGIIVNILYGAEYEATVGALRIIAWYTTFSYIGSVRNVWILAEEKQKYLWIINLSGAIASIVFNIIFIPLMGVNGAALSALLTQIFTNFILGFIMKPIRENNKIILRSLNPKNLIKIAKIFIK